MQSWIENSHWHSLYVYKYAQNFHKHYIVIHIVSSKIATGTPVFILQLYSNCSAMHMTLNIQILLNSIVCTHVQLQYIHIYEIQNIETKLCVFVCVCVCVCEAAPVATQ